MNNNQIVRIDKNIAYNILDFDKFSESKLIKDILFYISFSFQSDLFGFGTLDPVKFAKTMNISYANLFRKHDNPIQLKNKTDKEKEELINLEKANGKYSRYRLWTSNLENALYILKSIPVIQYYSGEYSEGERFHRETNFIILQEIEINYTKIKGQDKIIYRYKLNDIFKRNLRKFFLNADLNTYVALKKPNLDSFFISISNLIQSRNANGYYSHFFKFDELRELLKISPKGKTKDIKKRINSKIKIIIPLLEKLYKGIVFSWKTGENQRFAYIPVFSWDKPSTQEVEEFKNSIYKDLFKNHLKQELLENFRYNHFDDDILYTEPDEKTRFAEWLICEKNTELIKSFYIATYSKYNKTNRKYGNTPPETKARNFLNSLHNKKNKEDILSYLNTH